MRRREGGARQSPRPRACGPQAAPLSLVPKDVGLLGSCLVGHQGRGESRPALAGSSPPHFHSYPLSLLCPFPSPHPLLLSPHPSFIFSFFHLSLYFLLPNLSFLSLHSLSFLLYLLPFSSPFPPTCCPPSPSCFPPTRRGPEPTKEPSAAESPLSAEYVLLLIQCLISQAEVAVAGGREAGTWKMDEEYKNKMARTPGTGSRLSEILGSRPRAPSFSPTPPPPAGQSSERSPFWVWRAGAMGNGKAGAAERKYWRNQRNRDPKRIKTTKGIDRGLTLRSATCPQFQYGPQSSHTALLSLGHNVDGVGVLTMATTTLPPSLLGSTLSDLWSSPNLTQIYFLEVPFSPHSRSRAFGIFHSFPLGSSCHFLLQFEPLSGGQNVHPSNMCCTGP